MEVRERWWSADKNRIRTSLRYSQAATLALTLIPPRLLDDQNEMFARQWHAEDVDEMVEAGEWLSCSWHSSPSPFMHQLGTLTPSFILSTHTQPGTERRALGV